MKRQFIHRDSIEWEKLPVGLSKELVGANFLKNTRIKIVCLMPGEKFEHHDHEFLQISYFLSGSGVARLDDIYYDITPGLVVVIKPFQCHSFENNSEEKMEIITVETMDINADKSPYIDF